MRGDFLSLPELLGLDIRTHNDLKLIADSAAQAVTQEGLTNEECVKLNVILGYVSAKTGKLQVATHHYLWAFNTCRAMKLDVQLLIAAGIGVALALMRQEDHQRAKHIVTLIEAAVDENPHATVIERILLDQMLEQVIWHLGKNS